MKKFKLTETVETGFLSKKNKETFGGTIDVSLLSKKEIDSSTKNILISLIDNLDHCLITDVKSSLKFSDRYYLVQDASGGFLQTAASVLASEIMRETNIQDLVIEVQNSKETYRTLLQNEIDVVKDSFITNSKGEK